MAENTNDVPCDIDFVSLGMFIIDDIYPSPQDPDQTPKTNIVGGAGTYSALGARLLSPPPLSQSVGWIVDAGTDFPSQLREELESWSTNMLLRARPAPTTRGWNGYGDNEHRAFKYLTEKKRLTFDDLTPELLASRSFHLICGAARCVDMVRAILAGRERLLGATTPRPLIIWEPVPDYCLPSERASTFAALSYVDVLSPNHEELAALFGEEHIGGVDRGLVEEHARRVMQNAIGLSTPGAVVVRASKEGCCVVTRETTRWLPAYHRDGTRVVDPTGGGNGFLGGLAVGLVRSNGDVEEAARWGSVAASFCIEQVGVPTLRVDQDGVETWNNVSVQSRLDEYRTRT